MLTCKVRGVPSTGLRTGFRQNAALPLPAAPHHDTTIALFNAFLAEHRRKPKDAKELRHWYATSQKQ